MRRLIKLVIGLAGVLVVGGVVVGCVLGCTNVLKLLDTNDSKLLKPVDKINFVKYDNLSNQPINSSNNNPFINYNSALQN
ncbi:hypothetical protein IKS57_03045, partial [bacterium]|nr:hypothetical protein [bacterium]